MSSDVLVLPCVMEKILDYERPKQRKRTRKLKRNFEQRVSFRLYFNEHSSQYVIRADD
jgi:hypothetical protein